MPAAVTSAESPRLDAALASNNPVRGGAIHPTPHPSHSESPRTGTRVLVLSDPHFAGAAERARHGWEREVIRSPFLRGLTSAYRHWFWLRDPTAHNHQVAAFVSRAADADLVVANGDYSCDSAFVGHSDPASFASASECLTQLRTAFSGRLRTTLGDHEFGKMSIFGGRGGPRFASWERSVSGLGLEPLWSHPIGEHRVLVGVCSSLLALPVFEPELLPEERNAWEKLRREYLDALRALFESLGDHRRLLLFCHDPTALPFLAAEPAVQRRLPQLEATIIGHLHSPLILRLSRLLCGVPQIRVLGTTVARLSGALRKARTWRPFRVVLCPSPSGIQLLKDGGFLEIEIPPTHQEDCRIRRHRLPWK